MDAKWLAWTYFANPDYLVVQSWVHTDFLSPDTSNQAEVQVYHCNQFFLRVQWVTHLWACYVPDLWLCSALLILHCLIFWLLIQFYNLLISPVLLCLTMSSVIKHPWCDLMCMPYSYIIYHLNECVCIFVFDIVLLLLFVSFISI